MRVSCFLTSCHRTRNIIIRDVPVNSTVIQLRDDTLVIVDTGLADNPEFLRELEQLGLQPNDFQLVINTHLHCDHIGGNRLFNNARILISRREYEYESALNRILQESNDPARALDWLQREVEPGEPDFALALKDLACRYPVSERVGDPEQVEYFEDNPLLPRGISLLPVPGHTIDSRAVILQEKEEQALVAGDAFYHRDLWRLPPFKGVNYHDSLYQESALKIAGFNGIIIPGHDYAFDNRSEEYLQDDSIEI